MTDSLPSTTTDRNLEKGGAEEVRVGRSNGRIFSAIQAIAVISIVAAVAFVAGRSCRHDESFPMPAATTTVGDLVRDDNGTLAQLVRDMAAVKKEIKKIKSTEPCIGTSNGWSQGNWQDEIFVQVNTTACGFAADSKPTYFTSLSGTGDDIGSTYGAASIRDPTPDGFTVYVHYNYHHHLSPNTAGKNDYRIQWVAYADLNATQELHPASA
ncbi:expressed unknown protein [Seminavis robusta]|uniref:Uncharacterized protein n=1 Tax=Seminavis robusta TaxID=568900 RepID=A0A9N8HN55_9STRA|nr:expressed unknown protein [Seminavis robusta]|eukprot:Sro796_g203720.1 n/a (211) ;mRNA; r:16964-17596